MNQSRIRWCVALSVYAGIHLLPRWCVSNAGNRDALTAALCCGYWATLLGILRHGKRWANVGLQRPGVLSPALLVPFIPSVARLALYGVPQVTCAEAVLLSSAAFGEELLFRGAIPRQLGARGFRPHLCGILSALAFGGLHAANLASMGADVLWQIVYACCAGFGLCAVAHASKCVWIGFGAHLLLNLTASPDGYRYWPEAMSALLFVILGLYLYRKEEKGPNPHETLH